MSKKNKEWFAFDLDGTLATYEVGSWKGYKHIGKPITSMCNLAKELHSQGKTIKIFTARVSSAALEVKEASLKEIKEVIWKWCDKNLGFRPEITSEKDYHLNEFYDDRCIQVLRNSGITLQDILIENFSNVKKACDELTKFINTKDESYISNTMAILNAINLAGEITKHQLFSE